MREKVKISTPKDAIPLLRQVMRTQQETVVVLCLDGANQVSSRHVVTIGLVNQSQLHPREVFREAVRRNSVSILIAHSHPSGNLEPSEADLIATRRMVEVSKTIGIPVLDHIIVTGESFMSIRERYPSYFC